MQSKVSFAGLAGLLLDLTEEERRALMNSPKELKRFAEEQVARIERETYFSILHDRDVPAELEETASKWRQLAAELGYTGPVAWKVKAGFTLKTHVPIAGPCHEDLECIQSRELIADEPTRNSITFWIPRLVPGSKEEKPRNHLALLSNLRDRLALPSHHLSSHGSAALLAGLMLAYYKHTGERVPFQNGWVQTSTHLKDGDGSCCLDLSFDPKLGICCSYWIRAHHPVGCFPIGIESISE